MQLGGSWEGRLGGRWRFGLESEVRWEVGRRLRLGFEIAVRWGSRWGGRCGDWWRGLSRFLGFGLAA